MLGVPLPDEESLRERLKQSISNSRKKKYHGNAEDCNVIPSNDVLALSLLNENGDPFANYDEKTEEFLEEKDPKWKQATLEKFEWIR